MSTFNYATISTPDGPFTMVFTPEAVLASGWTQDPNYLRPLIHATLQPSQLMALPREIALEPEGSSEIKVIEHALQAVEAFYDGDASLLRQVPVHQKSGPYREHAWQVLRQVRPGETITYAQYAERTGNPKAARAAASACAKNAAALFVPCHRILRTDGSLGGFRYGLSIKESLLNREGN